MAFEKLTAISKPILWVSFFIGLLFSWSVLSGDDFGRVNLLYLIVLYVIFPCLTLFYSFLSFIYSPLQLSSLSTLTISFIQNNNFIFTKYKQAYLKLQQNNSSKLIFLYFSQLAAISFSVASLIVLFILLVTTDVHFIWRSTLLNSEQILNILELIAVPWQFWQEAQPNLDLISISQDHRMLDGIANSSHSLSTDIASSNWWKFILAVQLFYAFFIRFIVVLLLNINFKLKHKKDFEIKKENRNSGSLKSNESQNINKSITQIGELSSHDVLQAYAVNNWANISIELVDEIRAYLTGKSNNALNGGPCATESERLIAERWRDTQLIIVKSWEPPLAELSDFMQNSTGYILPLDIKNNKIVELTDFHLQEWYRFVAKSSRWELLLIPQLLNTPIVSQLNQPQ